MAVLVTSSVKVDVGVKTLEGIVAALRALVDAGVPKDSIITDFPSSLTITVSDVPASNILTGKVSDAVSAP